MCPKRLCPKRLCPKRLCPKRLCPKRLCPKRLCPKRLCPKGLCPNRLCPKKGVLKGCVLRGCSPKAPPGTPALGFLQHCMNSRQKHQKKEASPWIHMHSYTDSSQLLSSLTVSGNGLGSVMITWRSPFRLNFTVTVTNLDDPSTGPMEVSGIQDQHYIFTTEESSPCDSYISRGYTRAQTGVSSEWSASDSGAQ